MQKVKPDEVYKDDLTKEVLLPEMVVVGSYNFLLSHPRTFDFPSCHSNCYLFCLPCFCYCPFEVLVLKSSRAFLPSRLGRRGREFLKSKHNTSTPNSLHSHNSVLLDNITFALHLSEYSLCGIHRLFAHLAFASFVNGFVCSSQQHTQSTQTLYSRSRFCFQPSLHPISSINRSSTCLSLFCQLHWWHAWPSRPLLYLPSPSRAQNSSRAANNSSSRVSIRQDSKDQSDDLGVAYQGTPADPLVDTKQCQLDAKAMESIGTNSIRVYHVDPNADHDGCMSAFNDAGIYIWLDLDTFETAIVQATPTWTKDQFTAFAKVMDEFQPYDNLGGFWIGNEVINNLGGSPSAPYIKAAVADMKSYLSAKGYRQIPIGYSAADIAELRPMLQNYLACAEPDQAIDFYGLNSYEWCGAATYDTSGYGGLQAMALGYNIPIFFSETGCNVGGERTFNDQKAIFGPKMIDTWYVPLLEMC